jgi:hypothetical protein
LSARRRAKLGHPPPPFDLNLGFAAYTSHRLGASMPEILQGLRHIFVTLIVIYVIIDELAQATSPIRLFDVPDDCLATVVDVHMLDAAKLLPAVTQAAQNFHLHGIGSQQPRRS